MRGGVGEPASDGKGNMNALAMVEWVFLALEWHPCVILGWSF